MPEALILEFAGVTTRSTRNQAARNQATSRRSW